MPGASARTREEGVTLRNGRCAPTFNGIYSASTVKEDERTISEVLAGDLELAADPKAAAERAGLTYVSDFESGIFRKKWGRGFTYLDGSGKHIQDSLIRERIDQLVIPPGWTDVWICADGKGHIQATGRDAEGRKQYIYHPEWERVRNRAKFNRTIAFGDALSSIREHCESDLRKHGLKYEKVLAAVVFLLDRTLIRIGNKTYASNNGSFGLTTLRDRHVDFSGTRCTFEFKGKRGKKHCVELDDARLARIVRRCRDVPGYDLFQYYNADDERDRIEASDVNRYLKSITGQDFSAKDFRTWGASVQAAVALYEMDAPESESEADKQIIEMVKIVAERLGNTPAVCREYYIHPAIVDAHAEGAFRDAFARGIRLSPRPHMDREEMALLHFISQYL